MSFPTSRVLKTSRLYDKKYETKASFHENYVIISEKVNLFRRIITNYLLSKINILKCIMILGSE